MISLLHKVMYHYFPYMNKWIDETIEDPRVRIKKGYDKRNFFYILLLGMMLKLGSRNDMNNKFDNKTMLKNISMLSGISISELPDDETIANFFERIPPREMDKINEMMIRILIRNKVFYKDRLYGYYLIAVDGTGYLKFKEKHCEHCLKRKFGDTLYYIHYVLSAKLITDYGMALNIGTEFIENENENVKKQDCELKGFYRYSDKLKRNFPQMKLCLLLDSLYANQNVFMICEINHWKYIIRFKAGSIFSINEEYEELKMFKEINTKKYENDEKIQNYEWVNNINYKGHIVNILKCIETNKKTGETIDFFWITNFKITDNNCRMLANNGGRLRWKIENEGFNMQKNGGYNLKHAYSKHEVGLKNFYLFIQIAHLINQLIEKSNLLKKILNNKKSIKFIAFLLLEGLRNSVLTTIELANIKDSSFQIRLDTS